jgi:hypothetical protein
VIVDDALTKIVDGRIYAARTILGDLVIRRAHVLSDRIELRPDTTLKRQPEVLHVGTHAAIVGAVVSLVWPVLS